MKLSKGKLGPHNEEAFAKGEPIRLPNGLSWEDVWTPLPGSFKTRPDKSFQENVVGGTSTLAGERQDDLPALVPGL